MVNLGDGEEAPVSKEVESADGERVDVPGSWLVGDELEKLLDTLRHNPGLRQAG